MTRADRPLALKQVGVMAARGRRKRFDWYWADLRVCVCIDRKTGEVWRFRFAKDARAKYRALKAQFGEYLGEGDDGE